MNMFSKTLSVAVVCSSDVQAVQMKNKDMRSENGKTVNVEAAVHKLPKVQSFKEFMEEAMGLAQCRSQARRSGIKEWKSESEWKKVLELGKVAPWARVSREPSSDSKGENELVLNACDLIVDYEKASMKDRAPKMVEALKKQGVKSMDEYDSDGFSNFLLEEKWKGENGRPFPSTHTREIFKDIQDRLPIYKIRVANQVYNGNMVEEDLGEFLLQLDTDEFNLLAKRLEVKDSSVDWESFKSERFNFSSTKSVADRLYTARQYSLSNKTPTEFWNERSTELERQGWNKLTFQQDNGEKVWEGADGTQYEVRDGNVLVGTPTDGREIFTQKVEGVFDKKSNTTTYMPTPVIEKDLKVLTNEEATAFGLPTIPESSLGDDLKVNAMDSETESNSSSEDCCHGDGWILASVVGVIMAAIFIIFIAKGLKASC